MSGDRIRFMASKAEYEVLEVGIRNPKEVKKEELVCGEVGWISAAIKDIADVHVGDTITNAMNPANQALPDIGA